MNAPATAIANLSRIPGVGPSIASDLYRLGIRDVAELRGRDPESLYAELCREAGQHVDRCVLYVFRCAVYYASELAHDPALLKWWNWQDTPRSSGARNTN
jgi:hypothetical protein